MNTARITFQDFITPFSDAWQGSKSNYTFPLSDISPFVNSLSDPNRDIYIGIKGGSNPYNGDSCTGRTDVSEAYKQVGFKYSLSIVSTQSAPARNNAAVVPFLSASDERTTPIVAGPKAQNAPSGSGVIAVSIAGYGASSGGEEYSNTTVGVKLNNTTIGNFSTAINCAQYQQYSPRGNPGIFQGNDSYNPRSWCPGALVPIRYFNTGNISGQDVTVQLDLGRKGPYSSDSVYRTSLTLLEK